MRLIADGGSTKVDWCLIDAGREIKRIRTQGMNPYACSAEEIEAEMRAGLMPQLDGCVIGEVRFFGAGCTPEKAEVMRRIISGVTGAAVVEVESDLLAAARGLCGHEAGIVCILGTGSNSCYWDGQSIVGNVPALGYVLGDEGSGAVMGRMLVARALRGMLTRGLKEAFLLRFGLTQEAILEAVYRRPMANRFLAGLSVFLAENIADPSVYAIVEEAFVALFGNIIGRYDVAGMPVHFTGSVAYYYSDVLRSVARRAGVEVGRIERSPMDGLVRYYTI